MGEFAEVRAGIAGQGHQQIDVGDVDGSPRKQGDRQASTPGSQGGADRIRKPVHGNAPGWRSKRPGAQNGRAARSRPIRARGCGSLQAGGDRARARSNRRVQGPVRYSATSACPPPLLTPRNRRTPRASQNLQHESAVDEGALAGAGGRLYRPYKYKFAMALV